MWFIGTPKLRTDAFSQLASREQSIEFDRLAFGMHPFGFNQIEPGIMHGQEEGQNTNLFARLLDVQIVLAHPTANRLTRMPGGCIPDQEPVGLALLEQASAEDLIEHPTTLFHHGERTDWTMSTWHKLTHVLVLTVYHQKSFSCDTFVTLPREADQERFFSLARGANKMYFPAGSPMQLQAATCAEMNFLDRGRSWNAGLRASAHFRGGQDVTVVDSREECKWT